MRIGVDLGGTKIEAIALDDRGAALVRRRIAAPQGDYSRTIDAIGSLIAEVEREAVRAQPGALAGAPDAGQAIAPACGIGIGIPGSLSPATGLVRNANSTWLIGRPLAQDLEHALGRPVRIENDANCFAMSEAMDGAGAGADVVFGVILGTGVGGAVVVHGRVLRGAMAIAGEWGHNRLPASDDPGLQAAEWPGPACYCGRRGCIETFLSGPGWLARHGSGAAAGESLLHPPHAAQGPGRPVASVQALVGALRAGDQQARESFDRYVDRLSRALAAVINVLDPDVIVLGGGLSNIDELYGAVPVRWSRHVFSDRVDTRLCKAVHGDSSGVRGAAWLWPAGYPG